MNTPQNLDTSPHPLNLEKIEQLFPGSGATFVAIFEHAATTTMKDLANDPVAGREWMKTYYSLLKKLELTLVPELMGLVKTNDAPSARMEYRAEVIRSISMHLREALRYEYDDIGDKREDEMLRFIKGSLHRSIQLKWFIECLNDRRYRPAIENRCERVRKALENAQLQEDVLAVQLMMVTNEAEGYLIMVQDYLEKFTLKPPENTRLATTTLKSMNADLVADIGQYQAYEVADSYTVVKDLTQEPLLVTMGSCSVAPIFGWEGNAIGLASMKSAMYEELFQSGEASIGTFKSGEATKEQIDKVLGLEKGSTAKIDKKMEDRNQENDIGTAMLADSASILYIITWEGRVKIPESTVGFGELFSAMLNDSEKGEYLAETLRFQLLWYLRALTCRSEMQPKELSPSRIIQTVHKPRQIPSTMRLKMLPRDPWSSRTAESADTSNNPEDGDEGNDQPRKSPIPHIRRLPKGFYATSRAVAEAKKRNIKLAEEVQEDGTTKYIETFAMPRQPQSNDGSVTTIQAKFRKSATEALQMAQ